MTIIHNIGRSLRQISFIPLRQRWLNHRVIAALNEANKAAECGHRGEIRLLIERSMPLGVAFNQRIRERAEDLFAHLRIWDTVERSGVLIYLNLAEKRLELVADRGIGEKVAQETWQRLCDKAAADIDQGSPQIALEQLLSAIGDTLREHFACPDDPHGNELPDRVVVL
ncbi:TPM domain-containing protein [Suttonella sp. R2A3]|uniref:TPM domain-containing protein n=1 Tax=Suttonella sp. R2A3 TaxID=2908648 RepID=UPI001F3D19B1|nr:TPM domain-containing protein [Suttonella sp. R2A3]UJF23844.1 TPM domain-containing protein [Suttonella sp. R2A3]